MNGNLLDETEAMRAPTFKDPQLAFNQAIDAKQLAASPAFAHYAGHYMYMGTYGSVDHFKHKDTREYLLVNHSSEGRA